MQSIYPLCRDMDCFASLAMTGKEPSAPFPSPLVGEGGIGGRRPPYFEDAGALHRLWLRSGGETDEGAASAGEGWACGENPQAPSASLRHLLPQGEKESGDVRLLVGSRWCWAG